MKRTLIETVRVITGRAPLWSLHLDRLSRSCTALEMPIPALVEPRGGPDRVIRFEIQTGRVQATERPVGSTDPLHLSASLMPHRGYPHKLADRAWLQAARSSATTLGAEDALLFTDAGLLVEATRWAIGWWEGEALCFPPLSLGGLPSVARIRMGEFTRGGIQTAEVSLPDLGTKSLLACNAARGVVPVLLLDHTPLSRDPRTLALQSRFWTRPSA